MTAPPAPLPALHDPVRAWLEDAGQEALARFRTARVALKEDGSQVTDADEAAERILQDRLRHHFPSDALVGEEGAHRVGGPCTWYIDPIDGTHAFLEGLAHWGPTIGRVRAGDRAAPELGAVWFPRLEEYWFAARGEGAWRDGLRLPPLGATPLSRRSVLYLPSRFHAWYELDFPGKCRGLGSTAAHLCLVAAGVARAAFVQAGWGVWDVAGALCLLGEVGGVALTLDGQELDCVGDCPVPFVAGHPAAAEDTLRRIRVRVQAP